MWTEATARNLEASEEAINSTLREAASGGMMVLLNRISFRA